MHYLHPFLSTSCVGPGLMGDGIGSRKSKKKRKGGIKEERTGERAKVE